MTEDTVSAKDLKVGDELAEVTFASFGSGATITHVTVKRITKARLIVGLDKNMDIEHRWIVPSNSYGSDEIRKLEKTSSYHSPHLIRRDSETYKDAISQNRNNNSRVRALNAVDVIRRGAAANATIEQVDEVIAAFQAFRQVLVEQESK